VLWRRPTFAALLRVPFDRAARPFAGYRLWPGGVLLERPRPSGLFSGHLPSGDFENGLAAAPILNDQVGQATRSTIDNIVVVISGRVVNRVLASARRAAFKRA
jgi:hypothetical protein